jgi:hypothetical protein
MFKFFAVLLLISGIAIAQENKPLLSEESPTCLPFLHAMSIVKSGDYVPFLRKRTEGRVVEIIYSPKVKRAIEIWYLQPDMTKLPEIMCIGKVFADFEITDQFILKMKEFLSNPEIPI